MKWRDWNRDGDLITQVRIENGRVQVRQRTDAPTFDAYIDGNKRRQTQDDGYADVPGPDGGRRLMRRVAHLSPFVILWLKKHKGIDVYNPEDRPKLMRLLNDPDFRYLRTSPGSV